MRNQEWHQFFIVCADVLGKGHRDSRLSESWCGWTTFSALECGVHYWESGLPSKDEIAETHIVDSGVWGQPFKFDSLAHIVLPASFYWETLGGVDYQNGFKKQDIATVSSKLVALGIQHRITDLVLEIKLY